MKRKISLTEAKDAISILMKPVLAEGLAAMAVSIGKSQSVCVERFVELYLKQHELQPLPEGATMRRKMAGRGETKLRRYWMDQRVSRMLSHAEEIGYSASYVVEQAIIEGLTDKEQANG